MPPDSSDQIAQPIWLGARPGENTAIRQEPYDVGRRAASGNESRNTCHDQDSNHVDIAQSGNDPRRIERRLLPHLPNQTLKDSRDPLLAFLGRVIAHQHDKSVHCVDTTSCGGQPSFPTRTTSPVLTQPNRYTTRHRAAIGPQPTQITDDRARRRSSCMSSPSFDTLIQVMAAATASGPHTHRPPEPIATEHNCQLPYKTAPSMDQTTTGLSHTELSLPCLSPRMTPLAISVRTSSKSRSGASRNQPLSGS